MKLYDNNLHDHFRKRPRKIGPIEPYFIFVSVLLFVAAATSYVSVKWISNLYHEVLPDVGKVHGLYPVPIGKDAEKITFHFTSKRPASWKNLRQISRKAVGAVLMSEDGGFFSHKGYDPEAIRMALEYNSKPGVKIKRGGSTITQQVVKNLFLTREKTISRKAREILLAVEMERKFSKAKILEIYLNIAEWGPGIYGIERASWHYFQKPSSLLNAREGAILAFMLPNPKKYQFSYQSGQLSEFGTARVERILDRMWRNGFLEQDEYTSSPEQGLIPSNL